MKFAEYFLEDNSFRFLSEIRNGNEPWSSIKAIDLIIKEYIESVSESGLGAIEDNCQLNDITGLNGEMIENSIVVKQSFVLTEPLCISTEQIFIGAGTFLESGAIIKAPCVIGKNCEIRQGAYIRGNVIVGNNCVVGHVTEVKNSIFMNDTHAGHFAYVGDSILGSHVNLGAGTKLANLQFRSRQEIDENRINDIIVRNNGERINTGISKLGAVIGDYTEIGCNTVTSPGTVLGANCWIYPNTTAPKGFYPAGSIIKNSGGDAVQIVKRAT
ncbi:Glucosamine-1-phosphate N-acetyltransferase [hydrothermal vent metagenome]|uniref:Glucosamine-1-phosphate N-acetyltransferase n=1 Tax=hydrothermal vent metagenome TaxID=652676 RepID=A0A3B1CHA6_9ZZZZ